MSEDAMKVSRADSRLSHWLLKAGTLLAIGSLAVAVGLGVVVLSAGDVSGWAIVPLIALALFLATVVHEIGHVGGAMVGGMQLILLNVWQLSVLFKKQGLSVRWTGGRKAFSGFVVAYPHPDKRLRPAMLLFTAAGPLANFAAASLCVLAARASDGAMAAFWVLSASIHMGFVLANLIPARFSNQPNDGLLLWHWLRDDESDSDSTAFLRLMGRSIFGETADELEPEEVDGLEKQGGGMAFVADWIRIKAAQNRLDWTSVETLATSFEARVDGAPTALRTGMADLIEPIRAEIVFSRGMRMRDPAVMGSPELSGRVRWLSPHLQPRLSALTHVLRGEAEPAYRALRVSRAHAERSVDYALHKSEAILRAAIESLLLEVSGARPGAAPA